MIASKINQIKPFVGRLGESFQPSSPDPRRLILWLPVTLAAGSILYFSLPSEPTQFWVYSIHLGFGLWVLLATVFRHQARLVFISVLMSGILAGFLLAKNRTDSFPMTDWVSSDRAVEATGWIEKIERRGSRERAVIQLTALENATQPPQRIRIRMRTDGLSPGDAIRVRAILNKPPGPVMPGSYDPARAAWFDGIGLTGYAVTSAEIIHTDIQLLPRALARLRWDMAQSIRSQMTEREGGIAAALLTGDRSGVQNADAEALRRSGLGHILAISGMHMALLAGSIYAVSRFAFASWNFFARAHDPRKPAAIFALGAALGYLIISGASVPTQRAFIMTGVVLVGVILNRKAFSFRSLSLLPC